VLVIVAPGQGAQRPGFVRAWLELPGFAARLDALSDAVRLDLAALGTTGDAATLANTAVAQPLLVATGLCAARELGAVGPGVVAGHSVGEITAAGLAGVLDDAEAAVFVRERGRAMAEASAVAPTGMAAVLGGREDVVLDALLVLGLDAANFNGPGQIVAAGTAAQLDRLAAAPPPHTRVKRLAVAGAFHTAHMAAAVPALAAAAAVLRPRDPTPPVVSNLDGAVIDDGARLLARLVGQVVRPVRWDACLRTFARLGVTGLLELPPAGTLTGLARRGLPGVATFALDRPDQLDDARAFAATHALHDITN